MTYSDILILSNAALFSALSLNPESPFLISEIRVESCFVKQFPFGFQ